MPPRKKANSLFIPAKTLPGRSGRGAVNPPTITTTTTKKGRAPDLQDKGWVDQEKLAELDRERERKGLPSLKKMEESEVQEMETVVEEQKEGQGEEKGEGPEPQEASRPTAEDKGKGKMPTLVELAAAEAITEATTQEPGPPEPSLVVEEKKKAVAAQSTPEPALEPSLELATPPVVMLDEQAETFWKLIGFFNSAPPLSGPPALQPTTTSTPTKTALAPPLPSLPPLPSSPSLPSVFSEISPSSSALSGGSTSPSTPATTAAAAADDDDDDDKWETMSFVWGDDDPMWQSGWDFPHKPAFSIYKSTPWTEPNHELNSIMTVEIPEGAFDVAHWLRELYDTNVDFAANCKFEHPTNRPSANPFAPLQSSGNTRATSAADFYLNRDAIQKDLQEERPEWILSAYGPGRDAPEQLWGGILEQSPEEMRLHAMSCEAAGNLQGALSDFEMLKTKAMEKIGAAYNDPDAAINWIMSAANKQPNRLSLVANNMNGEFAVGKRPVGFGANPAFSTSPTNANPFGQAPSAPAQNANPFKSGTSGFGQPSVLGQVPSAFGQPAAMGSGTGFGQASALGQKPSAFGSPSALGTQNAFAQGTGFGQASSLGPKPNPFGAASPFSQTSQANQVSAFGQPSQPPQGGAFGQPSLLGAKPSAFSSAPASSTPSASPFSAFANNNNNTSNNAFAPAAVSTNNVFAQNGQQSNSPFAQPQQAPSTEVSMDSALTPTTNAFSATNNPVSTASPFGQPQQSSTSGFGQPSAANPFAQAQQSAFGQPAQQKPNPFAPAAGLSSQPAAPTNAAPTIATAGPSTNGPYGPTASRQHPAHASYAVKDPATGQLRSFKGRPVVYKEIDDKPTPGVQNMDGSFTKIWFPDGAPAYYQDTEPDREYSDAEKTVWQGFQQTGKFQLAANGGGGMPLAPPMREHVQWDF